MLASFFLSARYLWASFSRESAELESVLVLKRVGQHFQLSGCLLLLVLWIISCRCWRSHIISAYWYHRLEGNSFQRPSELFPEAFSELPSKVNDKLRALISDSQRSIAWGTKSQTQQKLFFFDHYELWRLLFLRITGKTINPTAKTILPKKWRLLKTSTLSNDRKLMPVWDSNPLL